MKKTGIIVLIFVNILAIYYFFSEKELYKSKEIDKILVLKSKRQLQVFSKGKLIKTYKISLGNEPVDAKQFEGGDKTSEGQYIINSKKPKSGYHLNLGISYPSATDIRFAKSKGKSPGGLIKIQDLKNGRGYIGKFHRFFDWTHGCIAVTNDEIEELYHNVKIGILIEIRK